MRHFKRGNVFLLYAMVAMLLLLGNLMVHAAVPGEVVVGVAGFGAHSDPHRGWGDQAHIMQHVYESLTLANAQGNIEPGLAESWEQLTPETVRFYLRKGVKFHNGEELTADVVKLNIDRMMDPDYPRQDFSFKLTGATVIDRYTIDITHRPANPYFLNNIALMGIMPSELVVHRESGPLAEKMIGTGPFRFVEWVPDERIVLEANDEYWRGAPVVRKITFRPIPETATRLNELVTGGIDVMVGVPFEFIPMVEASGVARIQTIPSMVNSVVILRADQPDSPLADKRVRQAMNYAINADQIISAMLGGYATRNATVLQPIVFGYHPDLKPYPYDPERARRLLAEAGYPNGFTLDYDISQRPMLGPNEQDISLLLAQQLADVGIRLNVNTYDASAWVSRVYIERNISPVFNFGWKVWHNEPGTLLFGLFHSDSIYAYTKNPELDALIDAARAEFDEEKARKLYMQIQELLYEEAPAIFLWHLHDVYAVSNRLNWQPRVDGRIYLYEATFAN